MAEEQSKDELIAALERAVSDTLAFFEGPGQASKARIADWGAWEVLAHFPYWHYATAWGIRSASLGGPAWQLSGNADETNAACMQLLAGESFPALLGQLREAQDRLLRAARGAPDLNGIAFKMADGREVTTGARLETIARHWRGHLEALQAAAG